MFKDNKILYFILGVVIITELLLYRLIIIRLPRDLTQVYIDICFFILFSYSITLSTLIYQGIKAKFFPKKPSNKLFEECKSYILIPLNYYYHKSLQLIDDYIKHTLMGPNILGANLKYFCQFMLKYFGVKHRTYKWIFVIFNIIPRIFLLVILSLDILYFYQFNYIYKFAWLVLVPIGFRYFIFTLKEFTNHNINILNTQFIMVKSVKYGYILDTTDLIRECCFIYREDIADAQPESVLDRTEAMPINQGHIYILREEPARVYNTSEASEAYFDRILETFAFMRKIRELVYRIEECPLYWKYLYFNIFYYSIHFLLWFSVFINLPNHYWINYELLFSIQDIEEPFSLTELTSTLFIKYINNKDKEPC